MKDYQIYILVSNLWLFGGYITNGFISIMMILFGIAMGIVSIAHLIIESRHDTIKRLSEIQFNKILLSCLLDIAEKFNSKPKRKHGTKKRHRN